MVKFSNNKKQKGFSLIELIVVLTIFIIIIGVTIDIFISMVKNQKKILEEQELLNQASYAMEYMSKALRAAVVDTNGSCLGTAGLVYLLPDLPPDSRCPNGILEACNGIKFINSSDNNACQEFFLDTTDPVHPIFKEKKNSDPAQNLLSDKFKWGPGKGRFIINGDKVLHSASNSDTKQPKVTFLLDILTASGQSGKIIQTTISQDILISGGP